MSTVPFLIVISGLPCAGKSTLAKQLSEELDLPLIDKDDILKPIVDHTHPHTVEQKRFISHCADDILINLAQSLRHGILCSFWHHPGSPITPGTPTDWLKLAPSKVIEIFCHAAPDTILERFSVRKSKLDSHEQKRPVSAVALTEFKIQTDLGPLAMSDTISVSTEKPINLRQLVDQIEAILDFPIGRSAA